MRKYLLFILTLICIDSVNSQVNIDTPNLSFENGSFTGWKTYTGEYYYDNVITSPTYGSYTYNWTAVTNTPRIRIISNNSSTYDPVIACNLLTNPNNKSVARLGNPNVCESWKGGNPYLNYSAAECIEYTFKVTENTTLLSYKLAAILHVPAADNHLGDQRPSYTMDITIVDSLGVSYSLPCSAYSSKAASGGGLVQNSNCLSSIAGSKRMEYVYQPWISGNVNLSAQIGKTVTISIKTHDCLLNTGGKTNVAGGHSAHGYFLAETRKIELSTFSCEDAEAKVYAPLGFTTYKWTRSDGKPITIPDPTRPHEIIVEKILNFDGVTYYCEMADTNGCGNITVSTTIDKIKLHPGFKSKVLNAGEIQFTDTSTVEGDIITDYFWDFGDGSSSNQKDPIHVYTTYTLFNVTLTITSKKGCSKIITQSVLPTKELIASIAPPGDLQYNGHTKDFSVTTNIPGLQINIDYSIKYVNLPGTPIYNSYTAPSVPGNYNATFELSYLAGLKYFMTIIPTEDFTITKAPLIVTIDDVSKTYGTKITLLREAFTKDLNPLYAGDKIYELNLTCNGLADTISVGNYPITTSNAIGLGVDNYDITFVPGTLVINPKPLIIKAIDKTKIYGTNYISTGKEFYIAPQSFVHLDNVNTVTFNCIGFNPLADVGSYTIVASNAVGNRLKNYLISYADGDLTVDKKKITVTANALSKVYGNPYVFTGKEYLTDITQFVGTDSIANVVFSSTATLQKIAVGEYNILISNISGYRLENYDIKIDNNKFTVLPMEIKVIPNDFSKEYGDLFLFNGREFTTDKEMIPGDTILFVSLKSSGYIGTAPIGKYDILGSMAYGSGILNYKISYEKGVLSVIKKKVNAVLNPPAFLGYNAQRKDFTATVSVDGLFQFADYNIRYTNQPGTPAYNGLTAPSTVGDYTATFELTDASLPKYYLSNSIFMDFTITKVAITLTADNASKTYGEKLVLLKTAFKSDLKPLYGNDKINIMNMSCNGLVDTASIGTYQIEPDSVIGVGLDNYSITFEPGTLTVNQKPLLLKAKNLIKKYGENLIPVGSEFSITSGNLVEGDIIYNVEIKCNGIKDTASIGNYPITLLRTVGNRMKNYNIQFETGELSITPKDLLIRLLDDTKVYGANTTINKGAYYANPTTLLSKDSISSVTTSSIGYDKSASTGTYTIKGSNIVGEGLDNYNILFQDATLLVTRKPLSVTAKPLSKVYGSEYVFKGDEFLAETSQLVGNDTINAVKLNSQATQKKTPVGEYILSISEYSGVGLDNYEIKMESNIFKVTPMPITVTAKNLEKEYSDVHVFAGNEFTTNIPLENGDTISFVQMHSVGTSESSLINEYDIIPVQSSGKGSMNYQINYVNGKLRVVQKELKVTAVDCIKEYGENDPELTLSVVDKRGVNYLPSLFSGKLTRQPNEEVGVYAITQGTININSNYAFTFTEGKLTIKKALPLIDSYFTNEGGQFIISSIQGTSNGNIPQGNLNLKIEITNNNINEVAPLENGKSIFPVSNLPNQMTVATLVYPGDNNYLPTTKSFNIFSIIYESNGGELVPTITNFDGTEAINLEVPTRSLNYQFNGWYETPDFTGYPMRRIPIGTKHDVIVYAKWSEFYEDLTIVPLFNQVLAVANPLNREFIYTSTFKWFKDGVQLDSKKQYCGFDNYIPSGKYVAEIYYQSNQPIILELIHKAIIPMSKVYPNPLKTNERLTLETDNIKEEDVSVVVLNSSGMEQKGIEIERKDDNFKLEGFVKNGLYVIQVYKNGVLKESHKVIVEK